VPRYEVLKGFAAGTVGPWAEGDEVNISAAQAAWVEEHAPGTLQSKRRPPPLPPVKRPAKRARKRPASSSRG